MRAIVLTPGTKGLRLADRETPRITEADQVRMEVLDVGICGTDREEAAGGRARAPEGEKELTIGHEMLGRVIEAGARVKTAKPGDYAVFTVRRGCGRCLPCLMNRSDMCLTGDYKERGIWRMDGYQTEQVVDAQQYMVTVPSELAAVGVLIEPLAVVEKAIDEVRSVQQVRLPASGATPDWFHRRRCLVAGLGPVGLLASLALRLRGAAVFGLDIEDEDTPKPRWLKAIGGIYVDGRKVTPEAVAETIGRMAVIFDATGIARLEFNLLEALAKNGVYVVTGIPGGSRPIQINGAELIQDLVLNNQVVIGSVNDAPGHFQMAVRDLLIAHRFYGDLLKQLITHRYPPEKFEDALKDHGTDEIKVVIQWKDICE